MTELIKPEIFVNDTLRGNANLTKANAVDLIPQEDFAQYTTEIIKCVQDPIYFCENYVYIVSLEKGKHIIKLYEKQKELLNTFFNNNRVVVVCPRQTGKTTTFTLFILYTICFNRDKKILVIANKEKTAIEIVGRVRLAFELLPKWIKPGVVSWNKTEIELDNGCKLECSSTSPDAARSKSCNVLIIDECVTGDTQVIIRNKYTGEIQTINIEDLFNISTKYKITNTDFYYKKIDNYEVLTPNGWSNFDGIKQTKTNIIIEFSFNDSSKLKCTTNHKIYVNENEYKYAKDLDINDYVLGENNIQLQIVNKTFDYKEANVYDLINVENRHRYYTNKICSSNCAHISNNIMKELYSSVYPIISSSKSSKCFMISTPNGIGNVFYDTYMAGLLNHEESGWTAFRIDWWEVPGRDEEWKKQQIQAFNGDLQKFASEFGNSFIGSSLTLVDLQRVEYYKKKLIQNKSEPIGRLKIHDTLSIDLYNVIKRDHCYVLGADVGDGVGDNYSTFTVLDITNPLETEEVCYYFNNKVSTSDFAYILAKVGIAFNKCPLMVEANNTGKSTIEFLHTIYEYENIASFGSKNFGILSNYQIKHDACLNIKRIFESDKINMVIRDPVFITELETFEKNTSSAGNEMYRAAKTKLDDRVMARIWAFYIFKEEVLQCFFDSEWTTINLSVYFPKQIKQLTTLISSDISKEINNIDTIYNNISLLNGKSGNNAKSFEQQDDKDYYGKNRATIEKEMKDDANFSETNTPIYLCFTNF